MSEDTSQADIQKSIREIFQKINYDFEEVSRSGTQTDVFYWFNMYETWYQSL